MGKNPSCRRACNCPFLHSTRNRSDADAKNMEDAPDERNNQNRETLVAAGTIDKPDCSVIMTRMLPPYADVCSHLASRKDSSNHASHHRAMPVANACSCDDLQYTEQCMGLLPTIEISDESAWPSLRPLWNTHKQRQISCSSSSHDVFG
jgi:hypothetical protein